MLHRFICSVGVSGGLWLVFADKARKPEHRFVGSVKHHKQEGVKGVEGVVVGAVGDLDGAPHLGLHLLLRPRVNLCQAENPHLW